MPLKARKLISIAASVLLLTQMALARVSSKELDQLADIVQMNIGNLQACGERNGPHYILAASELHAKLLMLVDHSGYRVDAFMDRHLAGVGVHRNLRLGLPKLEIEWCDRELLAHQRNLKWIAEAMRR